MCVSQNQDINDIIKLRTGKNKVNGNNRTPTHNGIWGFAVFDCIADSL